MESDTQNYSNTSENGLTNGISKIQALAIVQKANGSTHKEISESLGVPINTLKFWFSTRGTETYRAYKNYCEEIITQIGLDSFHRIRLQTEKAVDTIIELMNEKQPPAVRLRASMYVLDKDLPFTLKEKEDRANFLKRFVEMTGKMGVNLNDLNVKGEVGDKARTEFQKCMDLLDNAESWA
jgi:hypothetical protein